jgi:hypothetical protein
MLFRFAACCAELNIAGITDPMTSINWLSTPFTFNRLSKIPKNGNFVILMIDPKGLLPQFGRSGAIPQFKAQECEMQTPNMVCRVDCRQVKDSLDVFPYEEVIRQVLQRGDI